MKRLIVVDISSFIFRAFFAIRPMSAPDGTPVNAVYGVLTMLMKLLQNYNPTHVVLARDTSGGSFRNEIVSGSICDFPMYIVHSDTRGSTTVFTQSVRVTVI